MDAKRFVAAYLVIVIIDTLIGPAFKPLGAFGELFADTAISIALYYLSLLVYRLRNVDTKRFIVSYVVYTVLTILVNATLYLMGLYSFSGTHMIQSQLPLYALNLILYTLDAVPYYIGLRVYDVDSERMPNRAAAKKRGSSDVAAAADLLR